MEFDEKYVAMVWRRWKADHGAVPPEWANAFAFLENIYGPGFFPDIPTTDKTTAEAGPEFGDYLRRFGHLHAKLDPLGLTEPVALPEAVAGDARANLYSGSIAVETGHLDDPDMVDWIHQEFEALQSKRLLPNTDILRQLIETETFDAFLASKYPTKKRFGSEGADAILPMLHALRDAAENDGIDEIVMGSMHRGRLSILQNFAGMPSALLLRLIAGHHPFPDMPDLPADVAYHMGFSDQLGKPRLTLLPNPSHLEAINPVVVGFARARRAEAGTAVLPLILHTDASVVAQGVNAELLQMSALPGFEVGGTIHIVINNQIGFTTEPGEARSSRYCSGPWKAVDSLLLHVNGDDVDACVQAARFAASFRHRFGRDAVIDMVSYRANGHNEIDEPRFTQPLYYQAADQKQRLSHSYVKRLEQAVNFKAAKADQYREAVWHRLSEAFAAGATAGEADVNGPKANQPDGPISRDVAQLNEIARAVSFLDKDDAMPKLKKLMDRRIEKLDEGVDWALAESMAFGSILQAGISVRLCGQDIERGPFSQRHLAAIHPDTGSRHYPIASLAKQGAAFEVVNSLLAEYAVLGFEFGYSVAAENTLCVWEAQFGDFLNGAQIMMDQIISSGFEKWQLTGNLVMLLPHGLEGQGPEHSSARIERLLQLCANNNMVLAHPSTPANYFHLLQSQISRPGHPLVIISPKKLLRLPAARSSLAELSGAEGFRPVIASAVPANVRRAILCSGKVAYELEMLADQYAFPVQVIRIERLYPFPAQELSELLEASGVSEMIWLQEEPENFGAGLWLLPRLMQIAEETGIRLLPMVARPASASPAGSFHGRHEEDQQKLVRRALGLCQVDGCQIDEGLKRQHG